MKPLSPLPFSFAVAAALGGSALAQTYSINDNLDDASRNQAAQQFVWDADMRVNGGLSGQVTWTANKNSGTAIVKIENSRLTYNPNTDYGSDRSAIGISNTGISLGAFEGAQVVLEFDATLRFDATTQGDGAGTFFSFGFYGKTGGGLIPQASAKTTQIDDNVSGYVTRFDFWKTTNTTNYLSLFREANAADPNNFTNNNQVAVANGADFTSLSAGALDLNVSGTGDNHFKMTLTRQANGDALLQVLVDGTPYNSATIPAASVLTDFNAVGLGFNRNQFGGLRSFATIDNVQLYAIPEPSAAAALAGGLALLGALRGRRRRGVA